MITPRQAGLLILSFMLIVNFIVAGCVVYVAHANTYITGLFLFAYIGSIVFNFFCGEFHTNYEHMKHNNFKRGRNLYLNEYNRRS